jgi:EAL domain-containing protein (putative c-di-GMP-specific phosphodiesterase class I)
VSLAHALGLRAVAEGIESEGQLASMRELDCDMPQGFLFERPMPADEMSDLLATHRTASGQTERRPAAA